MSFSFERNKPNKHSENHQLQKPTPGFSGFDKSFISSPNVLGAAPSSGTVIEPSPQALKISPAFNFGASDMSKPFLQAPISSRPAFNFGSSVTSKPPSLFSSSIKTVPFNVHLVDDTFSLSLYGVYFLASGTFSLFICILPSLIGIRKNVTLNDHMENDIIAWLVSHCFIGMPTGCYLSWFIGDQLNKKAIVSFPYILPWLILAIADSHSLLYLSFLIIGFGDIVMSIPVFIYLKRKTCDKKDMHHTILLGGTILSAFVGSIIMFIVGMYLTWRQLAFIGFIIHILAYFSINSKVGQKIVINTPEWNSMKKSMLSIKQSLKQYNYYNDYKLVLAKIEPTLHTITQKLWNSIKPILIKFFKSDGGFATPLFNVHGPPFSDQFLIALSRLQKGKVLGTMVEDQKEEDVGSVIAIDWGTENSSVSVCKDGRIEVITNAEGNSTMPSYVAFPADGKALIGESAKNELIENSENTIFDLLRIIGLDFNDVNLQSEIKTLPFNVIEKNNRPYIQVNTNHGKKELALEQASSMILNELKKKAEIHLGKKVTHAIVTVPANFNDAQRRATIDAGAIANLKIMRIINESTAAAIASSKHEKSDEKSNILVYKLGSGSFDVRLLTKNGNEFNVIASGGNTHLGGNDFDQRVIEYCIRQSKVNPISETIFQDKSAIQKLRSEVEKAKRKLSYSKTASIRIESKSFLISPFNLDLSRDKFEEINMDLFRSTIDTVRNVLNDGKINKKDIDQIILSGGSKQIPKIQQMLREFFDGKQLICTSKEDVSLGAGKQAAILSGETDPQSVQPKVSEVNALSLGVDVLGGFMSVVIPRNTTIPARKSGNYTTVFDYQKSVAVGVYEGEHKMAKDNHYLDKFTLSGITIAPAGVPKLEVTMEIDINGILHVTERDKQNGSKNDIVIDYYRKRFGREDIDRMIKEIEQITR